jgi:hypothetical protein
MIIELEVLGKRLKMFLDSGAKFSYLSTAHTANLTSVGTGTDFYPGLGNFETPLFEVESIMAGKSFTVKYGNLPAELLPLISSANVHGIIGYDLFNQFQVFLDTENNIIQVW